MIVHETAVARLLWFAAKGQADDAQKYAGHMFKQGADLGEVRASIESMIGPGFYFEMIEALPWLAAETFGNPLVNVSPTRAADAGRNPAERIVELLTQSGEAGMRLTDLRSKFANRGAFDDAIEALERDRKILGFDERTAGRTARRYWMTGAGGLMYDDAGEVVRNHDPFEQAREVVRRARLAAGEPTEVDYD